MSQHLISRRAIGFLRTTKSTSTTTRLHLRTTRAISTSNSIRQIPNHGPSQPRPFSSSSTSRSIMPEHEDPPASKPEPTYHVSDPTPLSEEAYATLSEQLMEQILTKVEEVQEEREDVDVEYSVSLALVHFNPLRRASH